MHMLPYELHELPLDNAQCPPPRKEPPTATNKKKVSERNETIICGSRKHAVVTAHLVFHLSITAEGRFDSYFVDSGNC
jgi:hypothetical protein